MKFSHKLAAFSAILSLASLSIFSIFQYNKVQDVITNQVHSSIEEVTPLVTHNIDQILEAKMSVIKFTLNSIALEYSQYSVENILNNPSVKDNFTRAALGYNLDGSIIKNDPDWKPKNGNDARKQSWFKTGFSAGKDGKKIVIDNPQKDANGQLTLSIIAPNFISKTAILGVTFFHLNLDFLKNIVNDTHFADGSGQIFVVSDDGTIIAHPDETLIGQSISTISTQITISEEAKEFNIDGKHYEVGFIPLESIDWQIGYFVDQDDAYSAISDLRHFSIVFMSVAFVLILVCSALLIQLLMKPLNVLGNAIDDVATGEADLTQRLSTKTDQEFARLANGFNQFIERLQNQMLANKDVSRQIEAIAHETSEHADEANSSMLEQKRELDQLVTAMQELTSTSAEVASYAQNATTSTEQALQATEEGNETVENTAQSIRHLSVQISDAVEKTEALAQSTNEIESILDAITQISEQTNLLALNAAIEAARAGEQGRGFAVVADEVRTLAQRTQNATQEIQTMINDLQSNARSVVNIMDQSQTDVSNSVEAGDKSSHALQEISAAVTEATDLITQIASAAEQQNLVSEEVNRNTVTISEFADKVVEVMDKSNHKTNEQLELVENQHKLIDEFKL